MRRIFLALMALGLACGDDDGSTDAGSDVGSDVGVECTMDGECDDGLFCNGTETCGDGQCVAGAVVQCADEVECTVDVCDDEIDACVNAAPDADGDGVRDAACTDAAGTPLGEDCDDDDANRFPGNAEVCDEGNHDEDCDAETYGLVDRDADGFFDARCCNDDGAGGMNCGNDCDDVRVNVNMAATEACDGVDNDCNGTIDEGVLVMGFADADGDGFGDPAAPLTACPGRGGFVVGGEPDCDDDDVARNPGQVEVCDSVDNNCDDLIDNDAQSVDWYLDSDGDGFGNVGSGTVFSCEVPDPDPSGAIYVLVDTDCNDSAAGINPAAAEMCDGIDNDCNGEADFEIAPGDFEDDDADGIVDLACGPPRGVDCDDLDPATGGGAAEACDGRDNDCDGRVDEGATDLQWYWDGDSDGHGTDSDPSKPVIRSCMAPPGYVGSAGDCDDSNSGRSPDATETCNAEDDDCDAAIDEGGVCGCPPGLADCNGDLICETGITFDMDNCGACGMVCSPGTNVSEALCLSGGCRILDCDSGFDDCDGLEPTGCEQDLRSDANHCGACGNMCPDSGAAVQGANCVDFECELDCMPGFLDCDRDPSNGCEVNSDDDSDNCGTCGLRCDDPRGSSCVAGVCNYDCRPGETDSCNGPMGDADGCETFLGDPANCGGCGSTCDPLPGSQAFCANDFGSFSCRRQCLDDLADCDSVPANGCETPVSGIMCGCAGGQDCDMLFGNGTITACAGLEPGFPGANCQFRGCMAGFTDCFGFCADTQMDLFNCGGCNLNCNNGMCGGGSCTCGGAFPDHCPFTDGCVDTMFDNFNCGGCGNVCAMFEFCDSGTCMGG